MKKLPDYLSNKADALNEWKKKINDKKTKNINSKALATDLSKGYWLAKRSIYSKIKKKKGDTFQNETDAELPDIRHLQFLVSSTYRIKNLLTSLIKNQNETCEIEEDLSIILLDEFIDQNSHHGIMMCQMSQILKTVQWSRILTIPVLERIATVVSQFIQHGLADTEKAVKKMKDLTVHLQAGLMWMNDLSKELDPENTLKISKFKEAQNYVKETKIKLAQCKESADAKLSLATSSRNLILVREFKTYFDLMIEHFIKCHKIYQEFSNEFSGLPFYQFKVLAPILGDNNGGDELTVNKYRNKSLDSTSTSETVVNSLPDTELLNLEITDSDASMNVNADISINDQNIHGDLQGLEFPPTITSPIIPEEPLEPTIINHEQLLIENLDKCQLDAPKTSLLELDMEQLLAYTKDPKNKEHILEIKKTKQYQSLNDMATKLDSLDTIQIIEQSSENDRC